MLLLCGKANVLSVEVVVLVTVVWYWAKKKDDNCKLTDLLIW